MAKPITLQEILACRCPRCGAVADEDCTEISAIGMRRVAFHVERRDLAKKAQR